VPPSAGDGLRDAGGLPMRVIRGASFMDGVDEMRVTTRRQELESNRLVWCGVRPARAVG
jgi:hypothetical protein